MWNSCILCYEIKNRNEINIKMIKHNYSFKSEDIIIPKESLVIYDLDRFTLLEKLKSLINKININIETKSIPILEVPRIDRENIIYNEHGNYFLGKKARIIKYNDKDNEFLKLLRIIELIKELLTKNLHSLYSEIYWDNSEIFKDQKDCEKIVNLLATILQAHYANLNILHKIQGYCVGKLMIKDRNDIIECEALGSGGWGISPFREHVEIIESGAEFIIVVNNRSIMESLGDLRIWKKIPCILISTQSIPDYTTREFLKRLVMTLKIPVFGLVDLNPFDLNSLLTYGYGDVQTAHETSKLAINNFYWLGILCNDLKEYDFIRECQIPMNESETNYIKLLLNEVPVKSNELLREELKLMLKFQVKTRIELISSARFKDFVKYIIEKIEKINLIEF